jgi:hypothetical protein
MRRTRDLADRLKKTIDSGEMKSMEKSGKKKTIKKTGPNQLPDLPVFLIKIPGKSR